MPYSLDKKCSIKTLIPERSLIFEGITAPSKSEPIATTSSPKKFIKYVVTN